MIRPALFLVGCLLMVASGCSQGPSYEVGVKQDLMLLGLEIHNAKPSSQADLESKSKDAKKILSSNNYVYLPGIDMNLSNDQRNQYIVAYHKDTPSKGGYALSGDGSVNVYTKEEFGAAKKWDPNTQPAAAGDENNGKPQGAAPTEQPK